MEMNELNLRVLELLAQERALHGHGSAAEIDQRIGRSEGYLGRVLRGEIGLQTEMLFRILEVLEIDPPGFFSAVVGSKISPQGSLDRLARLLMERVESPFLPVAEDFRPRLDALVAKGRKVGLDDDEPLPSWIDELMKIDERRFSDPVSTRQEMTHLLGLALEGAEAPDATGAAHTALVRALGIASSIERVEGRARHAVEYLKTAFALHDEPESLLYAELLERACYQVGDQADYVSGMELAWQATEIYVRHGDLAGIGRSMVDRAVMAYKVDTPEATIDLYQAGLRYLPPSAWQNRFAAWQGMGMSYLNLEQVAEADRCARQAAKEHATQSGLNWWRLVWLQAEVAYRLGELDRSEALYRQVKETFEGLGNALDVALVSLQMARVLLAARKMREMQRLAASSMSLLRPLRRDRLACAALHEFTRLTLTGELSIRWVEQASRRIEEGYLSRRGIPGLDTAVTVGGTSST